MVNTSWVKECLLQGKPASEELYEVCNAYVGNAVVADGLVDEVMFPSLCACQIKGYTGGAGTNGPALGRLRKLSGSKRLLEDHRIVLQGCCLQNLFNEIKAWNRSKHRSNLVSIAGSFTSRAQVMSIVEAAGGKILPRVPFDHAAKVSPLGFYQGHIPLHFELLLPWAYPFVFCLQLPSLSAHMCITSPSIHFAPFSRNFACDTF